MLDVYVPLEVLWQKILDTTVFALILRVNRNWVTLVGVLPLLRLVPVTNGIYRIRVENVASPASVEVLVTSH